jgi:DNA-binding SARP family transcriptional activator
MTMSWPEGGMEFRVLGPLQVLDPDGDHALDAARKMHLLLAVMLVSRCQPVPEADLLDVLWGNQPPPSAHKNIQHYHHRLRRSLGAHRVPYGRVQLLIGPDDSVDSHQFRLSLAEAGAAFERGDMSQCATTLRRGLDLWRGSAYAGLDEGLVGDESRRLEEERAFAYEQWAEAMVWLGQVNPVISELMPMLRTHPYRERLRVLLMRALHIGGRSIEALDLYRSTRAQFVDELGVEPGTEMEREHAAILRGDIVERIATHPPLCVSTEPAQRPRELLAGPAQFIGRQAELRQLDRLSSRSAPANAGWPSIVLVNGPAGVGKTALTMHWAHRVSDAFTDGHCVIDLHGFGVRRPRAAEEALKEMLRSLGVATERIPAGEGARGRLFRSLVADRRMLIILDNARDADQVRPLIPGTPETFVVVTSRATLSGLVASHGAEMLPLKVLDRHESEHLLTARLGRERVATDRTATAEIVARCDGLPLALVVLAARVAAGLSLTDLATRLHAGEPPLDVISTGDNATDVRTVLSWSYQALSPLAATVFRRIGLQLGTSFSIADASTVAGLDEPTTRRGIEDLCALGLALESRDGRIVVHNLVRHYAAELAEIEQAPKAQDDDATDFGSAMLDRVPAPTLEVPRRRQKRSGQTLCDVLDGKRQFTAKH